MWFLYGIQRRVQGGFVLPAFRHMSPRQLSGIGVDTTISSEKWSPVMNNLYLCHRYKTAYMMLCQGVDFVHLDNG
jgi:hypothetical protein